MSSNKSSTALTVGGIVSTVALMAAANRLLQKKQKRYAAVEATSSKTVLIIGGGIGGLSAIAGLRKLNPSVKIILVEPKDHLEIYWASYRSPFCKWVAEGSLITLDRFCQEQKVQHVRALVTNLTLESVTLDNGQVIDFDVCVVATGAGAHWPGLGRGPPSSPRESTRQARLDALQAEGERILKSKSVLVVGGGLIGTELAGDIAGFSQKAGQSTPKVTLVHSGPQLCPIMNSAAANKVQQQLESLGVSIKLNDKAIKDKDGKLVLSKTNTPIDAELAIWTTGFVPLNGFMKDISGALDDKGWIETDEYFCVKGSNGRLFSIGDCTTTLPNSGNQVMRNVSILGHNIEASLEGKSEESMKPLSHGPEIYCNTAGPDKGVFYSPFFWTQYFFPWIKNKTMFFMSPKDMIGIQQ